MENGLDREFVEHFIDIDELMELKMKIPKRLDALELKALMVKADKLFKLSEVTIAPQESTEPRHYRKRNGKKSGWKKWTDDMLIELVAMNEQGIKATEIAEKINAKYGSEFDSKMVWQKIWYLQRKKTYKSYIGKELGTSVVPVQEDGEQKKRMPPNSGKFSDEMKNKIVELENDGIDKREIRDTINKEFGTAFSHKQIVDKINYMRKQGEIKK